MTLLEPEVIDDLNFKSHNHVFLRVLPHRRHRRKGTRPLYPRSTGLENRVAGD